MVRKSRRTSREARTHPRRNTQTVISIEKDQELEQVIFRGRRKVMNRRDLHVMLEPILRDWIRAAYTWDELAIGDYRFVIFSIDVAPQTHVYVQPLV